MQDASPIQCIANGTCNGVHGGLVTTATGAVVTSPGGGGTAGTYVLTLDAGLPGDVAADNNHVRVEVCGLALANATAQVTKVGGPAFNVFDIVISVAATGVATDSAFDFIVWKDEAN